MKLPRFLTLFCLFTFLSLSVSAQEMSETWAKTAGGSGNDSALALAVDHHGGVYVSGFFRSSTFTIDNVSLTNAGGSDAFLAKYDTSGILIWAKRFGGTANESIQAIAVRDNEIYAMGINFPLAKLDNNGNIIWQNTGTIVPNANPGGNSGVKTLQYLLLDSRKNIYFGDGSFTKYGPDGTFRYSRTGFGTAGIAIDKLDNVHIAGYHTSGSTWNVGPPTNQNVNVNLSSRAWFDSTGKYLGHEQLSPSLREQVFAYTAKYPNHYYYYSQHRGLAVDSRGTDFFGGNVSGILSGSSCHAGYHDWFKTNIEVDDLGNEFAAGDWKTVDPGLGASCNTIHGLKFGPHIIPPFSSGLDIFYLVKTGAQGFTHLGATKFNGHTNESSSRLAVDTNARAVYIVGSWSKRADTSKFRFANSVLTNGGNGATTDLLLLKFQYAVNPFEVDAGPDKSICASGYTSLQATTTGGVGNINYQWSPSTGLNNPSIANPIASPTVTTSYILTVTDGVSAIAKDTVVVRIDSSLYKPVITIIGGTNPFCEGKHVSLHATVPGVNYVWSNGITLNHGLLNVDIPGIYTVTATSQTGCVGVSDPFIAIMTPRTPKPTISPVGNGQNTVLTCGGNNVTLTAQSQQNPVTYLWSTGATTSSINTQTAGSYSVTATGANGCVSLPESRIVAFDNLPTGTITASGNVNLCSGDSVLLTVSTAIPNSVRWSTGATTNTIWAKTTGTYSATITSPAGCSNAAQNSIAVTVTPLPAVPSISASGPTTFCSGGNLLLTANSSQSGISFIWNTGATTSSISVGTANTYSVKAINNNGCISPAASIVVGTNPLPTASVLVNGNTTICAGDSVQLSVSTPSGNTILWNNGATTNSIWVKTSGTYSATITSPAGCSNATQNSINVTVNALPSAPTINANGPTTFCPGGNVILTAQSSQTGMSFLWSTGATTSSISVNSSGVYSVKAVNANGCVSSSSNNVTTTVSPLPTGTIMANGNTTICNGDSVQLTIGTATGNSVVWSTGATTSSIWVKMAGIYTAQLTSLQGCTNAAGNSITVQVTQQPTPSISQSGNTLTVNPAAATYQWYLNNVAISGATSQTLNITTGGAYSVIVANSAGCTATAVYGAILRIANPSLTYQVYPNPAKDKIGIVYTLKQGEQVSVRIKNQNGQNIITVIDNQQQAAGDYRYTVDAIGLPKGIAYVEFTIGNKILSHKLVIL